MTSARSYDQAAVVPVRTGPLRWWDYLTINLFWLGLNIRNTAVGSFFTPYLVALFVPASIKNSALGAISTAGLVIAMLVQPAAGLLSDRNTSRFGRRRPFIFVGVLLDIVFLIAIGLSWNFAALLVATLLIQFSANISHGPLQGLIPDLVPEKQRGRASAVKATLELVPIILVGITIASLIANGHLNWAIAATAGAVLLTMILTVVFVHEKPLKEKPATPFWPPMIRVLGMLGGIAIGAIAGAIAGGIVGGIAGGITWLAAGKATGLAVGVAVGGVMAMIVAVVVGVWAGALITLGDNARAQGGLTGLKRVLSAAREDATRNSSFIWWVVNRLLFLAAVTSIRGFAIYFLQFSFNISLDEATKMSGTLLTIIGVAIVVAALASGWLADRVGRKRLVAISGLVAAVGGSLFLFTIWMPNLPLIYVAGLLVGCTAGLFMTTNWALGTDLVPPAEAGRYLGVSNLAGAGAGMVGTGIGGLVADYLNGFRPGLGYFTIFAGFSLIFALSAVSLLGIRQPSTAQPPVEAPTPGVSRRMVP